MTFEAKNLPQALSMPGTVLLFFRNPLSDASDGTKKLL